MPLPEQILDFFREEAGKSHGEEIRMYLSSRIIVDYNWYDVIPVIQESKREWSISVLLSSSNGDSYDPVRKLLYVLSGIPGSVLYVQATFD